MTDDFGLEAAAGCLDNTEAVTYRRRTAGDDFTELALTHARRLSAHAMRRVFGAEALAATEMGWQVWAADIEAAASPDDGFAPATDDAIEDADGVVWLASDVRPVMYGSCFYLACTRVG